MSLKDKRNANLCVNNMGRHLPVNNFKRIYWKYILKKYITGNKGNQICSITVTKMKRKCEKRALINIECMHM